METTAIRRILLMLAPCFLFALPSRAQNTNIPNMAVSLFPGAPSGACGLRSYAQNQATGAFYNCLSGSWNLIAGSGAGVSSISGTANQIAASASTGAVTLSIPANLITGKTVNGVSYSQNYTGSTLDVRVNACITDAETHANGNTSGICDSSGESPAQTPAAQINVGDSSSDPVTWILPARCSWNSTINDGTSSVIFQYPASNIQGTGPKLGCVIASTTNSTSGSTGVYALYSNYGSGFYRASNFTLETNGNKDASGWAMYIFGAEDESSYHDFEVADTSASDTAGIRIGGGSAIVCCAMEIRNAYSDSDYTGPMPLDIEGASPGFTAAIKIGGSFVHPKAGQPNIKINDTYHNTSVGSDGVIYEEGNNTDTTTAFNQISGAAVVNFAMLVAVPTATSSTAVPVTIASNGSINTTFVMGAFSSNNQLANSTIVADSSGWCASTPCNAVSDAYGDMSSYSNAPVKGQLNTPYTLNSGTTFTYNASPQYVPMFVPNESGTVTESIVEAPFPQAQTLSNLQVRTSAAIASATSATYTVRKNGSSTSLTCTIAASAQSCSDLTHSFTVAVGDLLDMQMTYTGSPGSVYSYWSLVAN